MLSTPPVSLRLAPLTKGGYPINPPLIRGVRGVYVNFPLTKEGKGEGVDFVSSLPYEGGFTSVFPLRRDDTSPPPLIDLLPSLMIRTSFPSLMRRDYISFLPYRGGKNKECFILVSIFTKKSKDEVCVINSVLLTFLTYF